MSSGTYRKLTETAARNRGPLDDFDTSTSRETAGSAPQISTCSGNANAVGNEKESTSSLDPMIAGYECRDRGFGARPFVFQLFNKEPYIEKIEELDYIARRLDKHAMKMIGQHSDCTYIWEMITIFSRIHAEFKCGSSFVQSIMKLLDIDVRDAIGDVVHEVTYQDNHLLWTSQGRDTEKQMLAHLASANENCEGLKDIEGILGSSKTIVDAIQILRLQNKKVKDNTAATKLKVLSLGDDETLAQLKDLVEDKLIKCKDFEFWNKGVFTRAFYIGLADLWAKDDYKAILYILRKAVKMQSTIKVMEQPFSWTYCLSSLAGPHLGKFKGDSDTLMELSERCVDVLFGVMPRFHYKVLRLKQILEREVRAVTTTQVQLLTAMGASMVGAANISLRMLAQHYDSELHDTE